MTRDNQAGLTKVRLTPLRREILDRASRYDLKELPMREEKTAFALSQLGLLYYHGHGPVDYTITPAGRQAIRGPK